MDLSLSEEQSLLKSSVEKFVRDQYNYEDRRKLVQTEKGFKEENWKTFAELGWLCIPFSEEDGGIGGTAVETMVLMEQFGKGLVTEPYLATVLLAGGLIAKAGSSIQKEKYLTPIIEGQCLGAFAFAERHSRYQLNSVETIAKVNADGYTLEGQKTLVLNGASADVIVVSARTSGEKNDKQGVSLFVVDKESVGLDVTPVSLFDGTKAAQVTFKGVNVPSSALLGEQDKGLDIITPVIEHATIAVGAEIMGAMEALYKETVEYTKTRKQFGVAIGGFQALQHRMVDMFTKHEQCKSIVYRAVVNYDGDTEERAKAIAAMKYMLGRYGQEVAHEAVQLHGGMGMTEEMSIGSYLKHINLLDTLFGNADYHLQSIAANG